MSEIYALQETLESNEVARERVVHTLAGDTKIILRG